MPKKFNFTFENIPFCLEYIGSSFEGLGLEVLGKSFDYDCNIFRLHYLGEKGQIALSYDERLSKEIYYDSNGKFIDTGKEEITIFDYYYHNGLVKHINDLVNEKVLNNELEAKINVVFPAGKVIDKHSQHISCPLYNRWLNSFGKPVSGTLLPHLIVNEKHIPDSKYKGIAGLREITILDGNETIGNNAFADCSNWLQKVRFSNNLVEIGDSAFENTGLDVAKLPKTVKKIGKNAFRNTSLDVLAVYCDIEKIEKQDLLSYINGELSDGEFCDRKTIIILYDSNNIQQYTLDYPHWNSFYENPTKVFREIEIETGDRLYTRESSPWKTYRNAKKYDSLSESSWYEELNVKKALEVANMFKTEQQQSNYPKGWKYSKIILVPELDLDRAIGFVTLKKLKEKLIDYQERLEELKKWQQEAEQASTKLENSLPDFDEFNVRKEESYYLVINKKIDGKRN